MQKIKEMISGKDDTPAAAAANSTSKDHHEHTSGHHTDTSTHHTGTHTGSTTTAGPHTSSLENKLDPRVDSDLDRSRGLGSSAIGTGIGSHNTSTNPALHNQPGAPGTHNNLGHIQDHQFGHLEGQTRPNEFGTESGHHSTGIGRDSTMASAGHHGGYSTTNDPDYAATGTATHSGSRHPGEKQSLVDKLKGMTGGNKNEHGSTTASTGHHGGYSTTNDPDYAATGTAPGPGTRHGEKESLVDKLKGMTGGNKNEHGSTTASTGHHGGYSTNDPDYAATGTAPGPGTRYAGQKESMADKLADKTDPRFDSDRDGSRGLGTSSTGAGYENTTERSGLGGSTGVGGGMGSGVGVNEPTGHALSSRPTDHQTHHTIPLAEKLDPHIHGKPT